MKLVRVFGVFLCTFLLVACSNVKKEGKPDDIFRGELKRVYNVSEAEDKEILSVVSKDIVAESLAKNIDFNYFNGINVAYNDISEGIISNSAGEKKGCCKLPTKITFKGTEEQIKSLMERLSNINSKISIGDIKIEKADETLFNLTCEVNFFGESKGSKVESNRQTSRVQEVKGINEEVGKISLRNFDLLMVLRPSNSDAASITVEFADDSHNDGNSDSDANEVKDINITFTKEEGKYYCEISDDVNINKKQIEINDKKIIFDILSCKKETDSDKVGTNITLYNTTDKVLSVSIFDDADRRVNIIEKKGSIEVVK